jgi:RNA recognition motif-containing protein
LTYTTTRRDLQDVFGKFGNVVGSDINLNHEGRSRGTGIVLFETPADAQKAITALNGTEVNGRNVDVRVDRFSNPPDSHQYGLGGYVGRDGYGGYGTRQHSEPIRPNPYTDNAAAGGDPSATIYVSNV